MMPRLQGRRLLLIAAGLGIGVIGLSPIGFFSSDVIRPRENNLVSDTAYLWAAFNLARFGEFHNTRNLPEDRAAGNLTPYSHREPGFSLYLAAVLASSPEFDALSGRCLFGPDPCEAAVPVLRRFWRVTSVLAAAATAFMFVVTFLMTRSRAASVAAGLAGLAVMPMLAAASAHDFLAGTLLLFHAGLAMLTFRRPRVATGAASGLALGLLVLTKAVFQYWLAGVVAVLAVGLWLDARRRRALLPACAALAAAAWVTAAPWMLRNAVRAGHFGISLRMGEMLAIRAEFNGLTWAEVRGAFAYYLPDVSYLGAGRSVLMAWLEPAEFGYTRLDLASRRAYPVRRHNAAMSWMLNLFGGEVATRADRIDPRWRESYAARDAVLRQAAVDVISDDLLKHAALTAVFAVRGVGVFPDRCRTDVEAVATRFRTPAAWPMRQVCGAAGASAFLLGLGFVGVLTVVAWTRRDAALALLLSPVVFAFGVHALTIYFEPRYSRPLVPLLVVAAVLGARETWRMLPRRARSPADG